VLELVDMPHSFLTVRADAVCGPATSIMDMPSTGGENAADIEVDQNEEELGFCFM
jgi:hypothetical protein